MEPVALFHHVPYPALDSITMWSQVGLSSCLYEVIIHHFQAPYGDANIIREGHLIPS